MAGQAPTFRRNLLALGLVLASAAMAFAAADGSWLKHVPEADRTRINPYAGQADAIAAGGRVFEDHCAKCHGADAEGRGKKPSLRSARVQGATDGELFWLLKNGNLAKGMPTWNKLPDDTRWQLIAYVKSLGKSSLFSYSKKPANNKDGR
ncbi:MAG: c-type cytochrome [Candidatus Acidiferrum sp.]